MKKTELVTGVITLLYPLLIWCAHGTLQPRLLALLLLAVVALRLLHFKLQARYRWLSLGALALALAALWWDVLLPLKLYPVMVNLGMLCLFGASLLQPQSIIERLARLREPDLPAFAVAYTRRVTQVWCVFFAGNGLISLGLAIWASAALWSLYTGVISYLLMGLLFGGEYVLRSYVRRHA